MAEAGASGSATPPDGLAALASVLFVVGVAGQASAAACKNPTAQPPNPSKDSAFKGVTAIPGCIAWAVGSQNKRRLQTLIERWNGRRWGVQLTPSPGALAGVAAISSRSAWAVGYYNNGDVNQTLIERWNGKAWKVQPSSSPGGSTNLSQLSGVVATSSRNAWAVGYYFNGSRCGL